MKLEIHETDGEFEVRVVRPQRLARFVDHSLAQRFVQMMELELGSAEDIIPVETGDVLETEEKPSSAPPVAQDAETSAQPAQNPPASDAAWTDTELADAFKLLDAGEKLKDVAEIAGKSWTVLRGKWARELRNRKADAEDLAETVDDREECRLCGKVFRPTPERMDLCAACDRA